MRLIDADALRKDIRNRYGPYIDAAIGLEATQGILKHAQNLALEAVNYAPTIDAVEVVRRKDCRHYESDGGAMMICDITYNYADADDYCSYGERSE